MNEPLQAPRVVDPGIIKAFRDMAAVLASVKETMDAMARFVLPKAFKISRVLAHAKRRETLRKHRRHQEARRVAAKAGRRERTGRPSDKAATHA